MDTKHWLKAPILLTLSEQVRQLTRLPTLKNSGIPMSVAILVNRRLLQIHQYTSISWQKRNQLGGEHFLFVFWLLCAPRGLLLTLTVLVLSSGTVGFTSHLFSPGIHRQNLNNQRCMIWGAMGKCSGPHDFATHLLDAYRFPPWSGSTTHNGFLNYFDPNLNKLTRSRISVTDWTWLCWQPVFWDSAETGAPSPAGPAHHIHIYLWEPVLRIRTTFVRLRLLTKKKLITF